MQTWLYRLFCAALNIPVAVRPSHAPVLDEEAGSPSEHRRFAQRRAVSTTNSGVWPSAR
jgi:hypothetical protein